jgi:1-aminocyclopropane-1-carboxylate deaminase/D-cysteine desulfhydrase-like pyridoxal-dependent ACC family enzyme
MELTPTYLHDSGYWVKRDDLYVAPGGAPGGKARTCYAIATRAKANGAGGLITAGSRSSPQVNIVAQIGRELGLPVRFHTPEGAPGPEVEAAIAAGAERVSHKAGYNSVIVARALEDAKKNDWALIPFGMECEEAVLQTAGQVASLKGLEKEVKRIVIPVGSGMSLCGVLHGLGRFGLKIPVTGVVVGADPTKRLDKFCPLWRFVRGLEIIPAGVSYDTKVTQDLDWLGPKLDPIYEAKCFKFLRPGDLFWIVGIRQTAL